MMNPRDSVEQYAWTLPVNVCTCIRGERFPYPVAVADPDCQRHEVTP